MPADAQGACAPETSGQPPCVQSMQLHRRKDVAATNSPRTTMTLVGGRTMENSCETGPTGREADLSCCVDILRRAINSSCGKVVTCDVANQTTAKLTIRSRWGSGVHSPSQTRADHLKTQTVDHTSPPTFGASCSATHHRSSPRDPLPVPKPFPSIPCAQLHTRPSHSGRESSHR